MSINYVPPELTQSIKRFRQDYPDPSRVAFIMMRFGDTPAHQAISETVRAALRGLGIAGLRADDKHYHDDLRLNVLTYIYGCGIGVAVFERIEDEDFNANVAFELGCMDTLGKSVCLLKDRTLKTQQAVLAGRLHHPFDPHAPGQTIPQVLKKWLRDRGLAPGGAGGAPLPVQAEVRAVNKRKGADSLSGTDPSHTATTAPPPVKPPPETAAQSPTQTAETHTPLQQNPPPQERQQATHRDSDDRIPRRGSLNPKMYL
jgi:hypothetical protein